MRPVPLVLAVLLAGACGDSPTRPENQPSSLVVTAVAPSAAGTVVVPAVYPYNLPGGVVLPPGSGLVSVSVAMRSAREVPWARLNVYLLSGSGYCGQNLPDSPTWAALPAGWTDAYAVTGFQVYGLPCDVTAVRAMLHTRDSGLLTPPLPGETIAEATAPAAFRIERCCLAAR
jgi:hypothetical protein